MNVYLRILPMFVLFGLVRSERTCQTGKENVTSGNFHFSVRGVSRLKTGIISESNVLSLLDCSDICLETQLCMAYNYKEISKENEINCQLSHTKGHKFQRISNEGNDWMFYQLDGQKTSVCEEVNKCQNKGKMIWEEEKTFKCECVEGYQGYHCEKYIVRMNVASTITYKEAIEICKSDGKELCHSTSICKDGATPNRGVIPGDHWVPVADSYNQWLQIGNAYKIPCILHSASHGEKPGWGTTNVGLSYRGYLFCCN